MRWKAALAVPVIVAAGFTATASSAIVPVAVEAVDEAGPTGSPQVGLLPAEARAAETPRAPETDPDDPLSQLPPSAIDAAGGMAVLGDGPLAIPELVFYAYRAAEMQLTIDRPDCGLPWHLLAAVGRLGSRHADGGKTDVLGTLVTPASTPDGRIGPMRLAPAVWERFSVDGNADGAADPQNIFDSTLAAGAWMCEEGGKLREPEGEARAVALFDPSPEYLANVRAWSAAYEKGAEVAATELSPPPAIPVPVPQVAASAPAPQSAPAPATAPTADRVGEPAPADPAPAEDAPAAGIAPPALPPLPELPPLPCLVPAFCE